MQHRISDTTIRREHDQGKSNPVHRIHGRIVSQEEWEAEQRRIDPRYKRQRRNELDKEFERDQKYEWKEGLGDAERRRTRAQEADRIASDALGTRGRGYDYESDLRRRERWDDPLSSSTTRLKAEPTESNRPVCRFQAPSNRFGILPGYRWDGVIRGNDYERRWFERSNEDATKKNKYRYGGFD
jgi:pre-mRNA-splicing factor CWC26